MASPLRLPCGVMLLAVLLLREDCPGPSIGPLNGVRFRRANIKPGLGGPMFENGDATGRSCPRLSTPGGFRIPRTSLGKFGPEGVFGSTLSVDRFGLARRPIELLRAVRDGEFIELEDVDEAMEREA